MKTSADRIQKITSKGQITLPISWRRKMGSTSAIVVHEQDDGLLITPLRTEDDHDEEWVTLFDAVRDNNGKGIPIDEMIGALKKNLKRK